MHQTNEAIMALSGQKTQLPLSRNIGDAFAVVCQFFGGSPKPVARETGLDLRVARNALEGKAGVPAITQALQTRQKTSGDHYELWLAMGQMIFGESLDQYEERKLHRIISENSHAIDTLETRRQRRAELRSFTPADDGGLDQRRA